MASMLLLSILLPLAGAVLVWPAASLGKHVPRVLALLFAILTLAVVAYVVYGFFQPWEHPDAYTPGRYAEMRIDWLGADYGVDIKFSLSLDGISLWLYGLSALLMLTCVLVSWKSIDNNEPLFYCMLLLLLCGCLGVFAAQDLILFYVFFEFTLIPLFFLIGVWGSEQRRYAAMKFFVFTLTGSLLTFVGLLTLVFWANGYIGTAGAWNSGRGLRAEDNRAMTLTFDIPALQFRLANQYKHMLEESEHPNRRNRRIDAREAMGMPKDRVPRARDTYNDAVFFKVDTNRDGRIGYTELTSGHPSNRRAKLDQLYRHAFFARYNVQPADEQLVVGVLPYLFSNEELELREWAAATDDRTEDSAKELLQTLNLGKSLSTSGEGGEDVESTVEDSDAAEEFAAVPYAQLQEIDAQKLAAATKFELLPSDLDRLMPYQLDRLGGWTFTPADLRKMDFPLQMWIFLALFIGFAIKVPLFPLHTWLPLAHVQAPTAGSVFLAGILLKIGTYGFLRFNIPMLPEATAAAMPWLLWLSVAGIIYGALVALAQSDIKKLIAYSSVSHLGFCMLGMFALNPLGLEGSVLQMVNHGISTGALFAIVGMLYERYHTRQIKELGGLAYRMPVLAFFMVLFTMSSIGLPGLNGFVGEFLILLGMFQRGWADAPELLAGQLKVISVVAVAGVVLGAWYMLWLVQRVFFGSLREPKHTSGEHEQVRDLSWREILALAPLAVLVLLIGLWPAPFLAPLEKPLAQSAAQARQIVEQQVAATDVRQAEPLAGSPPRSSITMQEADHER